MSEIMEVRLPETSEDVTESLVVFWHRQTGDMVEKGEVLVEVQTEKAVFEVEAPASGRLGKIRVKRGEVAAVGNVLALIEPVEEVELEKVNIESKSGLAGDTPQTPDTVSSKTVYPGSVQTSPRVRKLARELGIELSGVVGTGPGGRLTEEDVRNHAADSGSLDSLTGEDANREGVGETDVTIVTPITPVRRTIAKRMMQSLQQSAQLTLTAWADVTFLAERRKQLAPDVSWNTWILRAVVLALGEHPNLNAVWEEDRILRFEHVHLGVATDTKDGLLVPSIAHAERLNLSDLHEAVLYAVEKAREGKLSSGELSGSTFTVTNLGGYGIQFFTPILNPPEAAILGVGQIEPHVEFSGRNLLQRERLPLSLTFDHRIVDGAPAARFLQTVVRLLAEPEELV